MIINTDPSTMHKIIPQAPSTSPIDRATALEDSDATAPLDVQLMRLENKSGEELHHESNTAINVPVP